MKRVWLGRERVDLGGLALLGTGGEAEVFALPDGRALKLFKGPDHPDLQHDSAQRDAAVARLDAHQDKLRAFPSGLPARVVAPETLATQDRRGKRVVGYAMRQIDGAEHLMRWANPRRRRASIAAARVVEVLLDLHQTITALHDRAVVIGDFNDLNVLVSGGSEAWLIDADSFAYGRFACPMFTERFVDPMLCDAAATAPVLVAPHGPASDWYAFAVMVMRTLLCVGPYGGVFRPRAGEAPVPHAARPLRRITLFDDRVVFPKPALPLHSLSDALVDQLRGVFRDDRRGPFPRAQLEQLAFTRCRDCGLEHAHLRCPACSVAVATPAQTQVRGQVRVDVLLPARGRILSAALDASGNPRLLERSGEELWIHDARGRVRAGNFDRTKPPREAWLAAGEAWVWDGEALCSTRLDASPLLVDLVEGGPAFACHGDHRVWISGGRLLSDPLAAGPASGLRGPRELGRVLPRRTRVWLGPRFGLALYCMGAVPVPVTFDPRRRGLADGHTLAPLRGRIVHAGAQLSATHAWLYMVIKRGASLRVRVEVLARSGESLAAMEAEAEGDDPERAWLRSLDGAVAVEGLLLVPTDAGIVRVEVRGGAPGPTRSFPDTAPFVDAAASLLAGPLGLCVVDGEGVRKLALA